MMTIDPKMMMIDSKRMTIDPNMMTIDPNLMTIDPKWMTIDPKMMLRQKTNLKITGPTGIFGENRDYKTMIGEPFANDLAHMSDE